MTISESPRWLLALWISFTIPLHSEAPAESETAFPSTERWKRHWVEDIRPYWVMPEALGDPVGNFPSFRDNNGKPTGHTDRAVRTISRQVYTYYVGFMMTGDVELLRYARAGLNWIETHAVDPGRGFHTLLDQYGNPIPSPRTAQDIAAIAMAYAMDYCVTRSPESAAGLDETVALITKGAFWNNTMGTIHDELDGDISPSAHGPTSTRLATILDQINTYLLLYAVQSQGEKRAALFEKVHTLGQLMEERFYDRHVFWNTSMNRSDSTQLSAGQSLKSYWMLHRTQRVEFAERGEQPFQRSLPQMKKALAAASGSEPRSFWGERFDDDLNVIKRDPSWWVQNELNQLCADIAMQDLAFSELLNQKAGLWLESAFIDRDRSVRGIHSEIRWDNTLPDDHDSLTSKAHPWKNGYHESEQCLVLHITSHAVLGESLELYFALEHPLHTESLQPYFYKASEVRAEPTGHTFEDTLDIYRVSFSGIQ